MAAERNFHGSLPSSTGSVRGAREANAYDEGSVWEVSDRWHRRVRHVFEMPNTTLGEERFRTLLAERARGGRVLDIGTGTGHLARELHAMGASAVYGFDVSQREIEAARAECAGLDGVTFAVHDADSPVAGQFDLIAGRSILHHLDFRKVLTTLFDSNLAPGGRMVFMEPMSHPLTLLFHRLVRSAHTPDEWPLTPADAAWLQRRFRAHIVPINLSAFPAGVLSSVLLRQPDNALTRMSDRVDRSLEHRPAFRARGRQGIIVINKQR